MGRITHQSIGKALPGRYNVVITSSKSFTAADCHVVDSLEEALAEAKNAPGSDEIFIIGGQSIYEQVLPLADKIYLTKVHAKIDGDKHFNFDRHQWKKVSSEPHTADKNNEYSYTFFVYLKSPG